MESRTHGELVFKKIHFLIKMRQYLNRMRKFLKVMELNYSLSRQLTDCKAKTFAVEAGQLTLVIIFSLSLIGDHVLFDKNFIG